MILLIVYILYLLFQLKSHAYMYQSTPQHIVDEEAHPGILRRMHSSSSSSATSILTTESACPRRISRKKIKAKLGRKRQTKEEPGPDADVEHAEPLPDTVEDTGKGRAKKRAEAELATRRETTSAPTDSRPAGPRRLASLAFRPPPVFRSPTEPILSTRLGGRPISPNIRRLHSRPDSRYSSTRNELAIPRQTTEPEVPKEPPMSKTASVLLLLGSTALVALCAEFMVASINDLVDHTPLSEAFVGLIILPIVGNAAEHVTAVTVAARNKMDLAIGVALGSSIQIATFITPLVVIIGWIMDKDMPLYFTLFETVTLFVATFVVNFLVLDGRSNYLEGSLLCASYVIIA